jgi:chemotaxis protein methyltransferase CheR
MDLSKHDFENIRDLIKHRSGIWLSDAKRNYLSVRLSRRMKATGAETVKEYFYYLKYDIGGETELNNLVDEVAIHETYFFRDEEQLEDFSSHIVPMILKKKQVPSPINIWSAGCSTGEEPYTLTMLLFEHPSIIEPTRIHIIGSDISSAVLQSAREGIYDQHSIRYVPPHYLLKYFTKIGDDQYAVNDKVKDRVRFAHVNLMDPFATARIREIDCIFCRNVILYFNDSDKEKCTEYLYRSLNKGGCLVLGRPESLGRISGLFEVVRLKHTVIYGKPG